ncbi:uncharacterized protein LOC107037419 [Diachasma alloeum]|uniref:uncharacterized protein LOC107037419 n=1 Tax=Diachasma alloeum TaxID=454923 RepID=UPI0007383AE0|nr:uncharacterized protein LOC107037419 [Diachasma alloeum]
MASMCGSSKSHPALSASSYYRSGPYPYQNDYYLPGRPAWSRVPPHSSKKSHRNARWKMDSALLIVAAIIVLFAVLAIAGLALWLGGMRSDPKNSMLVFSCSLRVARGEKYNPMLKLNTSGVFREKERKYKTIFESLFRRSVLGPSYKHTFIDRFENGTLKVFFRLYLDRRKIPRIISNVEDTIQDIIAKETYSESSVFQDMELDLTSLTVRRLNTEASERVQKPSVSQQRNTMITKNGVMRPPNRTNLLTSPRTKPKPSRIEPNEESIDLSNIPTIQGTYQATKVNTTTRGTQKTETKIASGAISIKSESSPTPSPDAPQQSKKTDAPAANRPHSPPNIEKIDEIEVTGATVTLRIPASTSPSAVTIPKTSTTEANDPFKVFSKPEFEESPWRPIIPTYLNTDMKLPSQMPQIPPELRINQNAQVVAETDHRIQYGIVNVNPPNLSNIEGISLITGAPSGDIELSLPSVSLSPLDSDFDFPHDRIVPEEMVNFRPNGKFKNKIPGVDDIEMRPDLEISGHLPEETFDLHLGTASIPSRPPSVPSVFPPTSPPVVPEIIKTGFQPQRINPGLPPTQKTDATPTSLFPGQPGPIKISGVGVAEPVLDLEIDLESRNKFSSILSADPTDDKTMTDRKVDQQLVPPVYTSYRTPDLNGGAKPSLIDNPGTLKPFKHTIPVDKINPGIDDSTTLESKPKAENVTTDEPKTEKPTDLPSIQEIPASFPETPEPSTIPPPTSEESEKNDEIIESTTVRIISTTLPELETIDEKTVPKPQIPSSPDDFPRNSTFIAVDTVEYTPKNPEMPESSIWTATNDTSPEPSQKTYNDTLNANIVKNIVTLAPAKSNTGVGRPIRPRPKIDKEKVTRVLEKSKPSQNVSLTDEELLKKLFGLQELVRKSSQDRDTSVDGNRAIESVVEVVTSVSTRVSTKVRTDKVVLSFDVTNSTSAPVTSDPPSGDEDGSSIEENRSFQGIASGDLSDSKLFVWTNEKAEGSKPLQPVDRRISATEEKEALLEQLKQFAEVRADDDAGSKKRNTTSSGGLTGPPSPEEIDSSSFSGNFDELKKLAAVVTGNKTVRPVGLTRPTILSRDGVEVLTKVLHKVADKSDRLTLTTERIDTKETECKGFLCNDGKCLPSAGRCNMLGECSNSEDEANCTCADFLRAQQREQKICDGVPDCWDYSDETHCDWCTDGQFVCGNSRFCVDQTKVCDGYRDCPEGEDEKKCAALIEDEGGEGGGEVEKRGESVDGINEGKNGNERVVSKPLIREGMGYMEDMKHSDDQLASETAALETTTLRIVAAEMISKEKKSYDEFGGKGPKVFGREVTSNSKNHLSDSQKSPFHVTSGIGIMMGKPDLRQEINGYRDQGFLSIRRNGKWGKLCLNGTDSLLEDRRTSWTVEDLGRAFCKAITYQDYERVEKIREERDDGRTYYSLFLNDRSSDKASLTFRASDCPSREVLRVKCKNLECGIRTQTMSQARIVGGGSSTAGSWPWQVALYKEGDYQCGGALINDKWVLSAAHCFYHTQNEYWVARIGATRKGNFPSPHEQILPLDYVILHPEYVDNGYINDVAVLRLEKPVTFSDYVRPICLPDSEPKSGTSCTVTGWGQLYEIGRIFPDTLQEVELPLISTEECRRKTLFLPLYRITSGMLCAGLKDGGRDACMGDSGGPLVCQGNDNRYTLHGITSNGYGCARPGRPGVYTKVHHYLPWIERTISSSDFPSSIPMCKGHRCPLGECLPKSRICNGFLECSDGSDERDCKFK